MYTFEQVEEALGKASLTEVLIQLDILASVQERQDICDWARIELEGYKEEAATALAAWASNGEYTHQVNQAIRKLPTYRQRVEASVVIWQEEFASDNYVDMVPVGLGVVDLEAETDKIRYRKAGNNIEVGLTHEQIDRLLKLIRMEARRKLAQLVNSKSSLSRSHTRTIGHWSILKELPGGGQGQVFLVERSFPDPARGVFKKIRKDRVQDHKARMRFLREIAVLQRLKHPYIVKVLDASTTASEPWIVTEYAPYGSLDDHIKTVFRGDAWRTLRMARDVASALQTAHNKKIIHRDIKPKNILLRDLNHAIVADFGVAHDADDTSVTAADEKVGPRAFAPHEWVEGHIQPTPAFDIFCLGGVIYCALSGGDILHRRSHLSRHLDLCTIFHWPELQIVNDLLTKMLAERPQDRLQTMEDVIREIDLTLGKLFGVTRIHSNPLIADSGSVPNEKDAQELAHIKRENEKLHENLRHAQTQLQSRIRPHLQTGSIHSADKGPMGGPGYITWCFIVTNEGEGSFELGSAKCEWLASVRFRQWAERQMPPIRIPDHLLETVQDVPFGGTYLLRQGDHQERGARIHASEVQPRLKSMGIPEEMLSYWFLCVEPKITVAVTEAGGEIRVETSRLLHRENRGPNEPF